MGDTVMSFVEQERFSTAQGGPTEDWFSYVAAEWQEYIVDLREWHCEIYGQTIDVGELLTYPWSRPSPPAHRRAQFYKRAFFMMSVVGVKRVSRWLATMPLVQQCFRLV